MWQTILIIGIICLMLEIFVPTLYFLNLAIAAFICAIIAVYYHSYIGISIIFCVITLLLLVTIRPLFIKKNTDKEKMTGMEGKYIGKIAKVIENVDKNSGFISIYDERWQARNVEDGVIEAGQNVEIVGYDSIVIKVKKIDQ